MTPFPILDDALWGFIFLTLGLFIAVSLKYRSIFHPVLFPAMQLIVMAGIAPLAQQASDSLQFPQEWWLEASGMTALYVVGITWPLLTPWNPLRTAVILALSPIDVSRRNNASKIEALFSLMLLGIGLGSFWMLIRESAVGWLWISDPRTAYMEGRTGSGHWYVLSQTFVFLAYLHLIWYQRPGSRLTICIETVACLIVMSLFGSKAGMVGVLVAGGVYYNYYVRQFTVSELGLAALVGIPVVLISPWLQGNFSSLLETVQYYDYFDNAARYIGRHERFGPQWGAAFLDSLWEYVPRRLVPEKPFVYGNIVVNEHFYPGAAREGYTPGWLPWIAFHRDFGAFGVLAGATLWGYFTKALYDYFLRYRTYFGFLCVLQVAFIPVLKLAPALYFCLLLIALSVGQRTFLLFWTFQLLPRLESRSSTT